MRYTELWCAALVCADAMPAVQVGILLFGATCIMTMGLASLAILPMHIYRYAPRTSHTKNWSPHTASLDCGVLSLILSGCIKLNARLLKPPHTASLSCDVLALMFVRVHQAKCTLAKVTSHCIAGLQRACTHVCHDAPT